MSNDSEKALTFGWIGRNRDRLGRARDCNIGQHGSPLFEVLTSLDVNGAISCAVDIECETAARRAFGLTELDLDRRRIGREWQDLECNRRDRAGNANAVGELTRELKGNVVESVGGKRPVEMLVTAKNDRMRIGAGNAIPRVEDEIKRSAWGLPNNELPRPIYRD